MTTSTLNWDPFDEELDRDPYPVWKLLRDEAPLYRNEQYDFWALSRFEDVENAHRDTAVFSSAHGTVLERMEPEADRSGMMIFLDPPDHTMLRRLVSRSFTPRRITGLDVRIREICADLLDPHIGGDGFDFVQDFGAQLPSRVISALVGVPQSDQEPTRLLGRRDVPRRTGCGHGQRHERDGEPRVGGVLDATRRREDARHRATI